MNTLLNFIKLVMFYVVLILIMFFAWYLISNFLLKKNTETIKDNTVIVNKPIKKQDIPIKEDNTVIVNKPIKKQDIPIKEDIMLERNRTVVNKPQKKKYIYTRVKTKRLKLRTIQLKKTNWAKEQFRRYNNNEESVFTSQN
jgi:cytoskeletal protein RodZ